MKKKLLVILLIPFLFAACSNQNANPNTGNENDPGTSQPEDPVGPVEPSNPVDPVEPEDPVEPSDPEEPAEPEVKTVKYTVDFGDTNIQTTDSTSSKFNEVMTSNINQNATILENVVADGYAQINDFGDTKALIVCSAKQDGSLIFNFTAKLVSITITASSYKKYIAYSNSYSVDEEPYLIVNSETWSFDTAVEKRELDKIEKKFEVDSTSLNISGDAGKRVFIHSFEMEFVDEQD